MGVPGWSRTAARNNATQLGIAAAVDGASFRDTAESFRELMAALRQQADDQGGALITGGSLNAYTAKTHSGLSDLREGVSLIVRADRDNTGAATLNVDGLGPLPWTDAAGAPLPGGRIRKDRFYPTFLHVPGDDGPMAWRVLTGATSMDDIPGLVEAVAATSQARDQAVAATANKLNLDGSNAPADPTGLREKLRASQILSIGAFALIAASTFDANVQMIRTNGYYAFGDEGGAQYRRSATNPGYPAYCQTQDANGVWWYLAVNNPKSRALGCKPDDAAFDCAPMLLAGIEYLNKRGRGGYLDLSYGAHHTFSEVRSAYEGIYFRGPGRMADDWFSALTGGVLQFPTARGKMPASIVGHHTTGDVIRFAKSNCGVEGFKITSAQSRWDAPATTLALRGNGVRWESDDAAVAANRCNNPRFRDMIVESQPGAGVVCSDEIVNGSFERYDISGNKAAGIVVDRGHYTGRTNFGSGGPTGSARIGILESRLGRIHDNGGEAIIVGHPSTGIYVPYRTHFKNIDIYRNCLIPANCVETPSIVAAWGQPCVIMHGEQCRLEHCGLGGAGPTGLPWFANGVHVSGKDVQVIQCRFIETNLPVLVVGRAGLQTNGIKIDGGTISAVYGDRPNFIQFEPGTTGIRNVEVNIANVDGVEAMTSTAALVLAGLNLNTFVNGEVTLADDAAIYYELDQPARGKVTIDGNAIGTIFAEARFRAGDASAGATMLPSSLTAVPVIASSTGTTGPMYGADGVDGEFRIQADTATPRLYIRNRSGAARTFAADFPLLHTGLKRINVFGPFPAIVQIVSPGNISGRVNTFLARKANGLGGYGARVFSYTGTLPPGLAFDTGNGMISGSPTTPGVWSGIKIAVTDSSGTAETAAFQITVT